MQKEYLRFLRRKLTEEDHQRLIALENPKLHQFVADAIELCEPDSVLVFDDSPEGVDMTRFEAIDALEENS